MAQLCQPRHRARAAHQDAGRPNTRTPGNTRACTVGVGLCASLCSPRLCLCQLSINGDKEFLDNTHKVNPFHLSPVIAVTVKQSEESQEAGPLPVKVDLSKTCV